MLHLVVWLFIIVTCLDRANVAVHGKCDDKNETAVSELKTDEPTKKRNREETSENNLDVNQDESTYEEETTDDISEVTTRKNPMAKRKTKMERDTDNDAVNLIMDFAQISDTVIHLIKEKYMSAKTPFGKMRDLPGREGRLFNMQKRMFLELPPAARKFINSVFSYAFLQLDGKMTKEQSAQAVLKKYRKLSYKTCSTLDESLFEDIVDDL
ncbi:hypothetical protein OSTOST_02915, partial [Ostertagia ostertagi]